MTHVIKYSLQLVTLFFCQEPSADQLPSKEDMTVIKVVFCRILGALHCYGYEAVAATDLARDLRTHTTVFFRLRNNAASYAMNYASGYGEGSHKFICVAPYGTDSVLLINVPKVAVEPILKVRRMITSPYASVPCPRQRSVILF